MIQEEIEEKLRVIDNNEQLALKIAEELSEDREFKCDSLDIYKGAMKMDNWKDQHPRKGLWDAEKVVEWILNNYETYEQTYSDNSGNHTYSDFQIGQFIRNLRKAMED